jgi:hypothetical protein
LKNVIRGLGEEEWEKYKQDNGFKDQYDAVRNYVNGKTEVMINHGDYAHVMITTSAYLATRLGKVEEKGSSAAPISYSRWGWETHQEREALSGWLGDAVLYSPGSGKGPSFERDDYMSNLDASNIAYLMKNNEISLNKATTEYYKQLTDDNTIRVKMFLDNEGPLEKIKGLIEDNTEPARLLKDLPDKPPNEGGYSDTFDFIYSLENGSHEMLNRP